MNIFLASLTFLLLIKYLEKCDGNVKEFIFASLILYDSAVSLLLKRGWLPPVSSMYIIIPVDHMSTLFEYSFFKATSGAINIRVPQC